MYLLIERLTVNENKENRRKHTLIKEWKRDEEIEREDEKVRGSEKGKVNEKLMLHLQDIKAAHVAIEAPFQVLLKLSMISLGILALPGTICYSLFPSLSLSLSLSFSLSLSLLLSLFFTLFSFYISNAFSFSNFLFLDSPLCTSSYLSLSLSISLSHSLSICVFKSLEVRMNNFFF